MPAAVRMTGITKRYGATTALDGVDFELVEGEIHAVLGENGAGKTTLMNILYGMTRPNAGRIEVFGRECAMHSPKDAMNAGIGMIHQHFMLVPSLTVAENLVLGDEYIRRSKAAFRSISGGFFIDRKRMIQETEQLSLKYGLAVYPDTLIEKLSVGRQQRVEILKALYHQARILILDEPTAVLTPQEVEDLTVILSRLRAEGHSLIFITHKLREVTRLADRVTVLRGGKRVATLETKHVKEADLAEMMVGRRTKVFTPSGKVSANEPTILTVRDLRARGSRGEEALRGITFHVRRGEILGIAGVDGNGQAELAECLAGVRRAASGSLFMGESRMARLSPYAARRAGIAQIPEDRHAHGLVLEFTVAENLLLKQYDMLPFQRGGFIQSSAGRKFAETRAREFGILAESMDAPAASLSGGNQQKVVVARELAGNPVLLVAFNPTRGLDVGAAEFVHETFLHEKQKGLAILLISTELEEILALSDRIAVLYEGRLQEIPENERNAETIGLYMLGRKE